MAITFAAQRRRQLREMDRRFLAEQESLAAAIGRLIFQAATARSAAGERMVPNTRRSRETLAAALYAQALKPYYLGAGDEPFAPGARPLSPYAQLLYDGVAGIVRIEAAQQAALVRRLTNSALVIDWLLAPGERPVQELSFESFTAWLDPRGYRLSDRIARTAIEVRSRVGRFLEYHVGQGAPAAGMAAQLTQFLTTGETGRTAYGNQGSYAARRLLQHEMITAGGQAVVAASAVNEYVRGAQWLLDPTHPRVDHCDVNATGGEGGDGVYLLAELPDYPDHINCRCHLRSVPVRNPAVVTSALEEAIRAGSAEAAVRRGVLNPERLTAEILGGTIQQTMARIEAAPLPVASVPAQPAPLAVSLPNERQRNAVLAHVDAVIAEVAADYGVTPAEIEAGARRALAELTDGKEIAVQIYRDSLDKILDDGRFKTVFETNSKVLFDADQRRLVERQAFGIANDTADRNRPVYGFVRSGAAADRHVRSYGELTVVLKESAKRRATLTMSDSLRNGLASEVAGSAYLQPGKESWDNYVATLYEYSRNPDQNEFFFITRYIEVQIQNGVILDDVVAIVDRESVLSLAQRRRLADLGIRVD